MTITLALLSLQKIIHHERHRKLNNSEALSIIEVAFLKIKFHFIFDPQAALVFLGFVALSSAGVLSTIASAPIAYNSAIGYNSAIAYNSPIAYNSAIAYNSPIAYNSQIAYNSPIVYSAAPRKFKFYFLVISFSIIGIIYEYSFEYLSEYYAAAASNYKLTLDTSLPGSAYAAYPNAAAPTAYGYGVIKTL